MTQANGLHITRLSDEQFEKMHAASLEILERIGVRLHLQEAIDLLKKAGARVEGDLVFVPHTLVEKALATAPKQVTLHDRHGNPVMPLGGNRCFFGPGSDCLNIIDHRSGERRRPVMQDVIEGVTLCDALPNIDFVMSMLLPSDVDQAIADTYQMKAMLSYTTKPILYVSYEVRGLVDAVEMAETVAGGEAALREKPILTCYINVVSGAVHNEEGLRKLLYLSGKGLPTLYIPGSCAGVTSPMTMAGAVALDMAGGLLGLVLAQLNREGAPFIVSAMDPAALDMKTMVSPYAYPERGIIRAVSQHYDLPTLALAGGSDSKLSDQQAAAEAALTMLADVLLGGNIVHDLGYLESGLTYSFAQLAVCDQIVSWIKAFTSEIEVSDETLALDEIAAVGPGGNYLATKHTKKHFRETWYPQLFERGTYADWVQKGSKTLIERASERVQKILAEHLPEPLPEDVKARLREIVKRAEFKT
ncbi:MAG: trimethylamine methyltransferase family protein [Anaerolineales bacterium]|nr:trimethylamine methyltransferase family protein [Anaerolineales bacterium]